jgi:hypothetical protein
MALRQELTAAGLDAGPPPLHAHLQSSGLPAPSRMIIWRILTREGAGHPPTPQATGDHGVNDHTVLGHEDEGLTMTRDRG